MRFLLTLVLATACLQPCAAPARAHADDDVLPAAAAAVLEARFRDLHVVSLSTGALHADGVRDIAVVLAPRADVGDQIVAVLWSEAGGAYRFATASGGIVHGTNDTGVEVRIAHRALFLHTAVPGTAVAETADYQFAFRDGGRVLRLIGLRTEAFSHAEDDADYHYVLSVNMLTGDKIDVIEDLVQGRKKRLERRSRVPLRQPIAFDQFDFDNAMLGAETRRVFGRDFKAR